MAVRIFATTKGTAKFSCPECEEERQLNVTKFNNIDREIKLKCTCKKCSHVFSVILERRMHKRKDVRFGGVLSIGTKKFPIKILDISRLGMKIWSDDVLKVNIRDKVVVGFTLDDAGGSKVSKEVIIKTIHKTELGVEFSSHEHYDKLGPYLLFKVT